MIKTGSIYMDNNCHIYVLYSKQQCKIRYIGVSIDPKQRFKNHLYGSKNKNGREYDIYKNRWIRTIDDLSFKVIYTGKESDCYELEKQLISKYKKKKRLVNSSDGGKKPPSLKSLNSESYFKTIEKIRLKALNRNVSIETRNKMSQSRRKNDLSYLKKFHKGKDNPRAKSVVQYSINGEFIKKWDYAKQAIEQLGLNKTSITDCLKGRQKTAGGYKWKLNESNK